MNRPHLGDFVSGEVLVLRDGFAGDVGMPAEWMWVRVHHCDDQKKVIFGTLDNEPLDDHATRQLRTDDTQTIFDAARAIMLNGIDDVAERGDLMERMLVIRCPEFAKGKRRPERYLQHHFDLMYPYLLGALCSVVSKTMAKHSANVEHKVEHKDTRMADFASWATAAEEALGYKPGDFMKAYTINQQELRYLALEFSPTITSLIDWKRGSKDANVRHPGHTADWTGTHQELMKALNRTGIAVKTSKALSVELARAKPALNSIGIFIEHLPREAGTGRRLIRILDTVTDSRPNRTRICDDYRKAHPEFRHESNEKIYKRAMGYPTVASSQPSRADAAKA